LDPLPLDPPELDPREPEPELDGRGAGRLTGGAAPPPRLWLLTDGGPADTGPDAGADGRAGEGAGGADAARGRGPVPAGTVPAERPAPRDQPVAGADADPPDPFGPPAPFAPCRGGRSSGGATRPLPPSASVTFLVRAEPGPEPPPTTRREPPLVGGRPLDDIVRDLLRPLLRTWLDENLPGIVERLVEAELARISARSGPG